MEQGKTVKFIVLERDKILHRYQTALALTMAFCSQDLALALLRSPVALAAAFMDSAIPENKFP